MTGEMRFRCGGCGNLTRFDVTSTTRTKRFLHFSIDGEPRVEEEEVLLEEIERVSCRWCGSADQIERIPRLASAEMKATE